MIDAIDIINFLTYITIGIMYILLIDLKYSMKNSLIAFSIFTVASYTLFFSLILSGLIPPYVNTTILAIPAAIFSIFLAKFKDSRFIFTLFTVDTFGLIVYIFARSLAIVLGKYSIVIIIIAVLLYAAALYLIFRYRKVYIAIQSQIKASWTSLAWFSMIAYIILAVLTSYPTPVVNRVHELPPVILVSLFIAFAYIIIYRIFAKEIEVYNEKNEKAMLELDNKYQKSQLELQKVYYQYAYEDEITGLKNRRALEEAKLAVQSNTTICLTLDINNLKEINDKNGHHAGDQALKLLSDALRETFVDHEKMYRIGGDEFVVLLNDHDIDSMRMNVDVLYQNLKDNSKKYNLNVSVAIGYSSFQTDEVDTFDDLLELADQRMYQDKAKCKIA